MKNLFLTLTFFFSWNIYSQIEYAEKNYLNLKNVLRTENIFTILEKKLNSIKLTFKDQRNNFVDVLLNRDIDYNYKHKRIRVQFDRYNYRIDLITKNDSIYFKSLKTEYFKKYSYQFQNIKELKIFNDLRNKFYNSNKNLKNLSEELTMDETYAMYCGDGLPLTKQGKKIKSLVKEEDVESLSEMMSSYNCEKQSFGVLGFSLLYQKNVEITEKDKLIIEYIKKRNSELQICSGCIKGIIEKIYK